MRCKAGDLAFIVNCDLGEEENLGAIVRVLDRDLAVDSEWRCVSEHKRLMALDERTNVVNHAAAGEEVWIPDECLRPIRDQPGNEQFVVESRKSLPRKKPVTGPVTINARGELE